MMSRLLKYRFYVGLVQFRSHSVVFICTIALVCIYGITFAEGTKQLEPIGAPSNSYCRIALIQNDAENRIPFALIGCSEEYRLNVRINNFISEKIYLGFGNIVDYFVDTILYKDVSYQVKDPAGNIVAGYSLQALPLITASAGFINTRNQVEQGPDINNTNPAGYTPLEITPVMNGDYVIEFTVPSFNLSKIHVFKYIDITVAIGNNPVPGRLWSKAWQLASGSVTANIKASYSLFYIYTNDSIVTRFDCNGMAGGVWDIYSNEWGCETSGSWESRRRSVRGNTSVQPQYKIFLNDPDPLVFPTGHIGKMYDFQIVPAVCDTVVTFEADVSKAGSIDVLLDLPPLNPNSIGPEDVQLGYNVTAGYNILLPAWNGTDNYGNAVPNGTVVTSRIRFLNGLSNVPLYDVEDNPKGFKVDLQRPLPVSGDTKLKLFWDDTGLPPANFPSSNISDGCVYSGIEPNSGCHPWIASQSLGDTNTINSWWYLTTDEVLTIPVALNLRPSSGLITGPANVCSGQMANFSTLTIPFAENYFWHLSGPAISEDSMHDSPDTTFSRMFPASLIQGDYVISVYGRNSQCGDGETVFHNFYVSDYLPPVLSGDTLVCTNSTYQYLLSGSYSSMIWSIRNGDIIGSPNKNPVSIRWHTTGADTIHVLATTLECGIRSSMLRTEIRPSAITSIVMAGESTSCPGLPLTFSDRSSLESGSIISRDWDWGNGNFQNGNDSVFTYIYPETGAYTASLKVTTDLGCESDTSVQILIIPHPEAAFSWYRNCISQNIELSDNSTGIDLAALEWDFGTAPVTASNLNSHQPEAVFHQNGQYPVSLVVTNKYGCTDTIIRQVPIHFLPQASFNHEKPCQGAGILFTDQSIPADTILSRYTWIVHTVRDGVQTYDGSPAKIVFDDLADHKVSLVAMDAYGCTDTASSIIAVKPKPDSYFEYKENTGKIKEKLHLVNLTTGAVEYYWDFGNGVTSTLTEPGITYTKEGEYTITLVATNTDGCTDTASRQYYYLPGLWLPNAFSPDNNGYNDVFRPVTLRATLEPYHLLIFDRWGQILFETNNPTVGWDGTTYGSPCPGGNYVYMISYRQNGVESSKIVTQRGTVSLIR